MSILLVIWMVELRLNHISSQCRHVLSDVLRNSKLIRKHLHLMVMIHRCLHVMTLVENRTIMSRHGCCSELMVHIASH